MSEKTIRVATDVGGTFTDLVCFETDKATGESRIITAKSDTMRQALEYLHRLSAFLPPDVSAWDNASNNKWLVAGKGATALLVVPG